MIVKYLLAALVAGLVAGGVMTVAQQVKVVPLILHAEEYEGGAPAHEHSAKAENSTFGELAGSLFLPSPAFAHGAEEHDHDEGGLLFGVSRFGGTLMANLVAGAGFALLLAGISLVSGRDITLANGIFWGACAWLAVHMLPSLGLPPELPGFPAADLDARQIWWVSAVALSGAGIWLLALRDEAWAKVLGLVLIAAPHLWGAPQPESIDSAVPAILAAEFAVAALATTLVFWLVLGLLMGLANRKIAGAEA